MRADAHTLILCDDEPNLRRMLASGPVGASAAVWATSWRECAEHDVACLIDMSRLAGMLNSLTEADGPFAARGVDPSGAFGNTWPSHPLAAFQPLWRNAQTVTATIDVSDEILFRAAASCRDEEAAKELVATVSALLTLGRNSLSRLRTDAARDDSVQGLMVLRTADIAEDVLGTVEIARDGSTKVEARASAKGPATAQLVRTLVPAVQAARAPARRMQSANNLRQIGLAMHNYHDTYKRFPAAAVTGPDGKTKHSWRVALLPYLEQSPLYEQYRLDEPWDSPHNKTLIDKMPDVYRHPLAQAGSTSSSYHALVGPGTVFSPDQGTSLADIKDGCSYTLMVVEAKRDVPWTKPEDIPFDPQATAETMKLLGGYAPDHFLAVFCDGSVQGIARPIDMNVLRDLIRMNDGNPVDRDAVERGR